MSDMIRVLFVCHGNICRSPMAEFICKKILKDRNMLDRIYVGSAAVSAEELGNNIYPPARRILDRHSIPWNNRGAVRITAEDYDLYDYIIGMDESNMRTMRYKFNGDPDKKLSKLPEWYNSKDDVDDPWYSGDFTQAFKDIYNGCMAFVDYLEEKSDGAL